MLTDLQREINEEEAKTVTKEPTTASSALTQSQGQLLAEDMPAEPKPESLLITEETKE